MNVSAIGTDDGKSTFEVQRTWNEKGKKAIAIGMYPTISVENCGMLDVSNMHLLNHANDFGWGELRMLNLYATVVNGKPSVSQLQGNSLAYIEEILETKDIKTYDIVVAWGNSMATHKNTIKAKIDLLSMLMEKGLSAKCITVDCLSKEILFSGLNKAEYDTDTDTLLVENIVRYGSGAEKTKVKGNEITVPLTCIARSSY